VEHVATCADALSCAAGAFYDVVVSDFELPDGLGSDVLAAIRVHAPETILILMSGGVIPASARVSVNLLLEKPFAHASLVRFLAGGRGTSEP
jgi:DNA-binding NtrC family response regulator